MAYQLSGKTIETDEEGYLDSFEDWTPEVAKHIAEIEGIELTDAHWEVFEIVKDFYFEYDQTPAMRPLVKAVKLKLGEEKGKSIYLMKLFPDSPPKQSAKIAGLPRPANCL